MQRSVLLPGGTDDEVARIRHSGVMNPNIFKLDKLLRELNIPNADEFSGEIPDDLIDSVVRYLERRLEDRANAEAELKKELEVKDKLLRDIEHLKDQEVKSKCQARYMAEKCAAQEKEQKELLKREQEAKLSVMRDTQLERRKTERAALEERKAMIENERLTNLVRKGAK